jgi:hypothetical protein
MGFWGFGNATLRYEVNDLKAEIKELKEIMNKIFDTRNTTKKKGRVQ